MLTPLLKINCKGRRVKTPWSSRERSVYSFNRGVTRICSQGGEHVVKMMGTVLTVGQFSYQLMIYFSFLARIC